jgi:hypothetical protein
MVRLIADDNAALRHFMLVANGLRTRINTILDRGISLGGATYDPIGRDYLFLDGLLEGDSLQQLITAGPEKLTTVIRFMKINYPDLYVKGSKLYGIAYNVFIDHSYKNLDKHGFVKTISIDTCAYCNRNYIYSLSRESNVKPEIDHFYPKDVHPFLGVSFYNLIPACEGCNGLSAKNSQDPVEIGLVSPYLIGDRDFLFSYKLLSSRVFGAVLDKDSIEVVMKNKIDGNLKAFHLDKLYQKHADHVLELILKSKVKYNATYRKYLRTYRKNGLRLSDNEIDRMILGNYSQVDQQHLRPFSKLYQDIGKELGLIKDHEN